MSNPLLSVVTITYNHEPYIEKTIQGVLMQKVNFPIEFIIAEDCSTDKTRAICQQYAKDYPDLIKLIISDKNVGSTANERRAMLVAKGKYIAFCEGDDYWTDPNKLQKQVDFLESHPDYSVCFHRCKHYNVETKELEDDLCGQVLLDSDEGIDIDLELYFQRWITQPLTMVYRTASFDLDIALRYKYYRDMHLIYHLLKNGKGYLFPFYGGIRLKHRGGIASLISEKEYCDISLPMDREFYKKTKDVGPRKTYIETLDSSIKVYKEVSLFKTLLLICIRFNVSKNYKTFLKQLLHIWRR